MNKDTITKKQGIYILSLYIMGTALILGGGTTAKQDTWIATLIAMLPLLPMLLVYGKIHTLFPQKHLFEILDLVFGRIIGKVFSILYTWYFFHLASICIRNITEFYQIAFFQETPQYLLGTFLAIIIIYMIKSGIGVLGRWSTFILPSLLGLLFILAILSIPQFKYENIKPVLYSGWTPIFDGALSIFAFPFCETVVFLSIFHTIKEEKNIYSVYFLGIIIGTWTIFITILKNTFALGYPLVHLNYFPSYYTNMIITIGFLQRVEAISSIVLLLCGFLKASVSLFAVCIGLSHILNLKEYKDISVPITLFSVVLSIILYSNTMEMIGFIEVYKYYALPFQVFFPILILVVGSIRKKKVIKKMEN